MRIFQKTNTSQCILLLFTMWSVFYNIYNSKAAWGRWVLVCTNSLFRMNISLRFPFCQQSLWTPVSELALYSGRLGEVIWKGIADIVSLLCSRLCNIELTNYQWLLSISLETGNGLVQVNSPTCHVVLKDLMKTLAWLLSSLPVAVSPQVAWYVRLQNWCLFFRITVSHAPPSDILWNPRILWNTGQAPCDEMVSVKTQILRVKQWMVFSWGQKKIKGTDRHNICWVLHWKSPLVQWSRKKEVTDVKTVKEEVEL